HWKKTSGRITDHLPFRAAFHKKSNRSEYSLLVRAEVSEIVLQLQSNIAAEPRPYLSRGAAAKRSHGRGPWVRNHIVRAAERRKILSRLRRSYLIAHIPRPFQPWL